METLHPASHGTKEMTQAVRYCTEEKSGRFRLRHLTLSGTGIAVLQETILEQ